MKKREIGGREAERFGSGEGDKIEVEKVGSWEAESSRLKAGMIEVEKMRRWEAER